MTKQASQIAQSTYNTCSDQELITLFQNGDNVAIATLIERYKQKVFTAIKLLVKDHYLAEDLFQDTFIKIIQNLQKNYYLDQGKFLPWALRIAHNLCIDHFRKTKKQVKIVTEDGVDITSMFAYTNDNVEKTIEQRQLKQSIYSLLEALPMEQREVIVLRIYADLSFKEIAKITNVSINTALGRMRYGLINMGRMIKDKQLAIR